MKKQATIQEEQILRSVGDELNAIRKKRKMTYADLARESGYCLQHICNVLRGRCADFATMAKIANVMDASFWLIDNTKSCGIEVQLNEDKKNI